MCVRFISCIVFFCCYSKFEMKRKPKKWFFRIIWSTILALNLDTHWTVSWLLVHHRQKKKKWARDRKSTADSNMLLTAFSLSMKQTHSVRKTFMFRGKATLAVYWKETTIEYLYFYWNDCISDAWISGLKNFSVIHIGKNTTIELIHAHTRQIHTPNTIRRNGLRQNNQDKSIKYCWNSNVTSERDEHKRNGCGLCACVRMPQWENRKCLCCFRAWPGEELKKYQQFRLDDR